MKAKTRIVIFSNYSGSGPYETNDIVFNHLTKKIEFRDLKTRVKIQIDIEEIDYMVTDVVQE